MKNYQPYYNELAELMCSEFDSPSYEMSDFDIEINDNRFVITASINYDIETDEGDYDSQPEHTIVNIDCKVKKILMYDEEDKEYDLSGQHKMLEESIYQWYEVN